MGRYDPVMSALALEIDQTLQQIDSATATRLERLVREALALVKSRPVSPTPEIKRQAWLQRLDRLRESVGTGKAGTSTEAIIEDTRSERD